MPKTIAIIDPPYGINVVGDNGNIGGSTKQANTTNFRKVIGDENEDVARMAYDLLSNMKLDGIIVWGGNYFTHFLPKGGRWFVWDKNRPEGLSLSDCELAWSNLDGVKVQKLKCTWDGYHKEGESGTRVHPNQKPIKLMVDLIKERFEQVTKTLNSFYEFQLKQGTTLKEVNNHNQQLYNFAVRFSGFQFFWKKRHNLLRKPQK